MSTENGNEGQGTLGLLSSTAILVGAMVGSAIFSLSGLTMLEAGPAAILSWLCGGLILLVYGLTMAELAGIIPHSGGVYVFPRQAFGGRTGQWIGWLACWCAILTNITAIAFGAIYVGTYLSVAFSWAANLQVPLALASIALCFFLNIIRLSTAGKINAVIVAVLLATMGIYISTAFGSKSYDAALLFPFFSQGASGPFGWIAAIPTAMIGFSGIISISFMVADVRTPRRTVPLSMLIAIVLVALLYVAMIAATLGLVSAAYLNDNPGMRFIPLFAACFTKLSGCPWLTTVVSISAVLALLTTMLICITMNARAIHASALDGALPRFLGKSNANGVPAAASALTAFAAAVLACFPGLTSQIVNLGALFNVITILATASAVFAARKRMTYPQNAFKTPGGNLITSIFIAIIILCNATSIATGGTPLWIYSIILITIGILIKILA